MSKETYIIELSGHRYEVRAGGREREIMFNGNWIGHTQFVDELAKRKEWSQLCEMAKLGICKQPLES